MADPDTDDVGADPEAADDDAGTGSSPKAASRPDPKADVEARRAATKARMDREAGTATPDDPTGTKARRRGKAAPMGTARADDPTGAKARREAAATTKTKKVPRPSKRTGGAVDPKVARSSAARSGNPRKAAEAADESSRYTAPIPRSQLESPTWVPVVMFALLGAGMLVIFLTYVLWEGRPLSLGVGLACILGGILAATQYR